MKGLKIFQALRPNTYAHRNKLQGNNLTYNPTLMHRCQYFKKKWKGKIKKKMSNKRET